MTELQPLRQSEGFIDALSGRTDAEVAYWQGRLHECHWVMDHIEALLECFTYTDEAREVLLTLHMLLLTQSEHRAHWAVQANGGKPPAFPGEMTREVRP